MLTERSVSKLKAPDPSGKQKLHWDDALRGFGVLVSGVSTAKSYVVQHALRDGRKRRVTIGPTSVVSMAEARERAREILGQFWQGRDPKVTKRGDVTLQDALDHYLETRTDLRPRSAASYRDLVERHLSAWLDTPLRDITRDAVEDRLKKIARDIKADSGSSGHATANGAMRALRAIYNHAADRAPPSDPLPQCPVKLKKVWFPVEKRTGHLTAAQLPAFYEAVDALQNRVAADYVKLVLFTGLRRREATSLRWQHVDLKKGVLSLPAASTKAKRPLDLPLTDFVRDLLVARRALGDAKWVFPSVSKSGHIEEPRFFLSMTGFDVSVHDLRRTFVTVAESCDLSHYALKALVNHALAADDVTGGYVQMNPDRLREPAQKVADKMKALCKITPPEGAVRLR